MANIHDIMNSLQSPNGLKPGTELQFSPTGSYLLKDTVAYLTQDRNFQPGHVCKVDPDSPVGDGTTLVSYSTQGKERFLRAKNTDDLFSAYRLPGGEWVTISGERQRG